MVLCRDDTSRESCMQTYILILWPHNEAHIWPCRRVGDLCSMVQQRPKLEMVAWLWPHFARWSQISPYNGGAVKMCQRKGSVQSNSLDRLVSESFPCKNGDDMAGSRQLILVSHKLFFICGVPLPTSQQRV